MSLPFDRVVVNSHDPPLQLSAQEFMSLPLDRRIGYVLSRQIEFFLGSAAVERRRALASLQQAKQGG